MPRNLLYGLAAGITSGLAALVAHPDDTQPFFDAAVQVIPVFLVAMALERSLAETLGTETGVINEQIARADREWTPPSSETRAYYSIGFQLGGITPRRFLWRDIAGYRAQFGTLSDVEVARSLPRPEQLNRDELQTVLVALASRIVGRPPPLGRKTRRLSSNEVLAEWDALWAALNARGLERAKEELVYETELRYRARKREQQLSVVASLCTLAAAQTLAFVGVLSPGHPYLGLFVATVAATAASFVAITVDAARNVFSRDLDVQSAGLDWHSEPVGSHWDR